MHSQLQAQGSALVHVCPFADTCIADSQLVDESVNEAKNTEGIKAAQNTCDARAGKHVTWTVSV